MILNLNLPQITRTKGEAKSLASTVFPPTATALAQMPPNTTYPRYQFNFDAADKLQLILEWLHEKRPKIYQRARFELFYGIAQNIVRTVDDNAAMRIHEMYRDSDHREFIAKLEAAESAQTMAGYGYGI